VLITCPHCGARPHAEFTYGGDGGLRRPADPASASDEAWHEYLYIRANPRGRHREYWHHTLGCDQWIAVERDTLSHQISQTSPAAAGAGRRG
jgi:heterotetrameric sarcosine oxidase delta subunit